MSIESLVVPFGVFTMVVGALVKLLLLQHQKRMDEKFDELKKVRDSQDHVIGEIGNRVTRLEESTRHGPRHSDLLAIQSGLAKVTSDNENQTRMLERLSGQVSTIQEYLMNNR